MVVKLSVKGLYAGTGTIRRNPKVKRSDYPVHIVFRIPVEGDKPSREDFDRFDAIDAKIEAMEADGSFLMVGCMWHDNVREWFIYARTEETKQRLLDALKAYEGAVESMPDPKWEAYGDLMAQLDGKPSANGSSMEILKRRNRGL